MTTPSLPTSFFLSDENASTTEIEYYGGAEAALVVVVDPALQSGRVDDYLERMRGRAERLAALLQAKGVKASVHIEWGKREDIEKQWAEREKTA